MTPIAIAAATWLALLAAASAQDDPYPPGTYKLTPRTDLHLEARRLDVPPRFADTDQLTWS